MYHVSCGVEMRHYFGLTCCMFSRNLCRQWSHGVPFLCHGIFQHTGTGLQLSAVSGRECVSHCRGRKRMRQWHIFGQWSHCVPRVPQRVCMYQHLIQSHSLYQWHLFQQRNLCGLSRWLRVR